MVKKVLITGVSGQTGSYAVDYLLAHTDCEIVGIVRRLSVPNHRNISHIKNKRFRVEVADVTDKTSITNLIVAEKPDYFINFAANSFVGNSWEMPYNHMETNFLAVLHQLEAIKNNCPLCRYYNAGSSEEWGNIDYSPQDELHPLKPRSPYAVSKIAARHTIKVYRESYGLYAIQGSLTNHESKRRGDDFLTQKVAQGVARIKTAITQKKSFTPIELGNLEAKRDWSHAADFVHGIWRMVNQEKYNEDLKKAFLSRGRITAPFEIRSDIEWLSKNIKEYVLSSNETHSIREFVEKAFGVAGIKGSWQLGFTKEDETFEGNSGTLVKINPKFYRPAEVDLLCGDSSLARRELLWVPHYNFDSLVEEMVLSALQCPLLTK